jgi:outer membrane protein OmpA-like peptidoglycan-associated protein
MAVSRENAAEKKSADDLIVRVPDQATPGKKKARKRSPWGLLVLTVLITGLALSLIYQTNPELARLAGQDLMAWVGTVIKKDDSIPVGKSSPATTQPDEKLGQGPVVRESSPVMHEPEIDAAIIETVAQEPGSDLPQAKPLQLKEELQQSGLLVEQMDDDVLKVNLSSDGMFAFDSAWIKDDARPALKSLTDVLRKRDELSIQVVGHTDSSGSAEYNLHLSKRRAKAVADYLIGQGLTDSSIQSEGRGDQNTRLEDSAGNNPGLKRRVEIYIRRDQEG